MTNQLIDISRTKTPEKQLERRIQEIISSYTDFQETSQMAKLTGLRRSDIDRLTWGDVHEQGKFTRLIFRQKKTKGREYLGIAGEARALMGVRGESRRTSFHEADDADDDEQDRPGMGVAFRNILLFFSVLIATDSPVPVGYIR